MYTYFTTSPSFSDAFTRQWANASNMRWNYLPPVYECIGNSFVVVELVKVSPILSQKARLLFFFMDHCVNYVVFMHQFFNLSITATLQQLLDNFVCFTICTLCTYTEVWFAVKSRVIWLWHVWLCICAGLSAMLSGSILKNLSSLQWRSKALRSPGSTVTWGPPLPCHSFCSLTLP